MRPKIDPLYDDLKMKTIPELLQLYKMGVLNRCTEFGAKQSIQPIKEESKSITLVLFFSFFFIACIEIEEQKDRKTLSKEAKPSRLIIKTWWFHTKDWPPRDYDYNPLLQKCCLCRVNLEEMETQESMNTYSLMLFNSVR